MTSYFMDRTEVMGRLRIKKTGLRNMMLRGEFPKPAARIGKAFVWPTATVEAWLAAKLTSKAEG